MLVRSRNRSSWASGRGYVPSYSIGFCVAITRNAGSTRSGIAAADAASCSTSTSEPLDRGDRGGEARRGDTRRAAVGGRRAVRPEELPGIRSDEVACVLELQPAPPQALEGQLLQE